MTADRARLARLLGDPDLGWLVDRARQRMERSRPLTGTVTLSGASPAQRAAAARLLGRPTRGGASLSVPLDAVDRLLRRSGAAPGLRAAVEALTGPVADRVEAAAATEAAWQTVLAGAQEWAGRRCWAVTWLEELRAAGLLRRLSGGDPAVGRRLLDQARAVLDRLPAGGVPRSRLAAEAVGDGHALDDDRPLATLVLRAVRILGGTDPADGRRAAWAAVGVLVAELTAPVLTLGLPGDAGSATGRALGVWAEAGQPVHLTLRQLVRDPPRLALCGWDVFVCENPTVVAEAATRLGGACRPLVCVAGHPAGAATTLLRLLADAGAALRYHGDFDWAGVVIANGVVDRFGARPWRLSTTDYRVAAGAARGRLTGAPVAARWDASLAGAMRDRGVRVEEELVLDRLLADLAPAGPRP